MPKGQKNTWKRKYATAEALEGKCNEYFAKCDKDGHLYGEAGLALHLGVKLDTLRKWYDGKDCSDYQDIVQMAYLRIQSQFESEPAYMEKGMVTKSIFMLKQKRFGGYQDKIEANTNIDVNVKMGKNVDASCFE